LRSLGIETLFEDIVSKHIIEKLVTVIMQAIPLLQSLKCEKLYLFSARISYDIIEHDLALVRDTHTLLLVFSENLDVYRIVVLIPAVKELKELKALADSTGNFLRNPRGHFMIKYDLSTDELYINFEIRKYIEDDRDKVLEETARELELVLSVFEDFRRNLDLYRFIAEKLNETIPR